MLASGVNENAALDGSYFPKRGIIKLAIAGRQCCPQLAGARCTCPIHYYLMVWMKLAVVGLENFGKLHPHELSGSMKKRAAAARARALDPEIVVFDEPSAGLDPIVASELDELILFLKDTFHMTALVA